MRQDLYDITSECGVHPSSSPGAVKNVLKFSERPQTHASAARQHLRLHGSLPSPETCIEKQTHSDPQRWEILRQSQQKHIIQRPPPVYPPHLDFISQLSRIFNGCKLSSQLVFCSSNQIREQASRLRPPEGTLAFYAFPRKRKVNSPVYCQNFQRKIKLNIFCFSKFPCEMPARIAGQSSLKIQQLSLFSTPLDVNNNIFFFLGLWFYFDDLHHVLHAVLCEFFNGSNTPSQALVMRSKNDKLYVFNADLGKPIKSEELRFPTTTATTGF